MALDYKKILAASLVYEVKNEQINQIQRDDIDTILLKLRDSYNPNRIAKEPGKYIFKNIFLHIHPALIGHYINLPGFVGLRCYPKRESAVTNEIGFIGSFRIIIDSSLEDYVINGAEHDSGNCSEDNYISIAESDAEANKFNPQNYIVIKSH